MSILSTHLTVWAGAGWGLIGGLCVEALWLYSRIRGPSRFSWRKPIPEGRAAYLVSVVMRVGLGAGLAAAATGSDQVSGSLAAFGLGVAAPLVLEKLAQTVPLTGTLGSAQENKPPRKPALAATDPPGEGGEAGDAS